MRFDEYYFSENENFKTWFKNSKVVDKQGNPLVVYHGTDANFTKFKKMGGKIVNIFGTTPVNREGYFFASTEEQAKGFGKNILKVYLSLQNPIDLTNEKEFDKQLEELESVGINPRWIMKSEPWELFDDEDGDAFISALKKLGYDGAIFEEPDAGVGRGGKAYVAFYPNQIKSVNSINFNTDSDDINENYNTYEDDEKYNGKIEEIKYLPVSSIHRQEMDFRPEVMSVSDEVAKNMDYSEPVEVTIYRYASKRGYESDDRYPEVTLIDGHHRTAAAIQTGREYLPVEAKARNAKGSKINKLIQMSKEIEKGIRNEI